MTDIIHRPPSGALTPRGNRDGRKLGSRNRFSKALIEDLTAAWERDGANALLLVAKREPARFLQLAFGVLPRDVLINVVEQRRPGGLDADDWALLTRVLDLIKAHAPAGSTPGEVFEVIETALRAHFAKEIADDS
jgi:hypothetical protein